MAILTNFPLDCNDQIDVIEIFHGLMRQWDNAEPRALQSGSPQTGLRLWGGDLDSETRESKNLDPPEPTIH